MGSRLYLLTFTLLLIALQSPAQRHRRRHEQHASHISRLPDSVSTSDDVISDESSGTIKVDSVQTSVQGVQDNGSTGTDQSSTNTDQSSTGTDTSTTGTPESPPVLRSIPDTAIRHWKADHDFDYANDLSLWKKDQKEEENVLQRVFDSNAFRWLIYILLGGLLLYALYKIISENNLRFFYRKPVRLKETAQEEAGLPEEGLDQLLKKAVEGKEYRMATRYLYLMALHHLDQRELIRWHSQATDEEYVRQMDVTPQGERFRWLTSAYQRVWYGKFPLEEHQFSRLSQYFQDFHKDVDHPQHS
jgi:hypothetical protein